MKIGSVNIPMPALYVAGGVAAFYALGYAAKKAGAGAEAGARAIANSIINENPLLDVNQSTPYQGAGVVGTLGNIVNRLLGGVPQRIGEHIGGVLADANQGRFQP